MRHTCCFSVAAAGGVSEACWVKRPRQSTPEKLSLLPRQRAKHVHFRHIFSGKCSQDASINPTTTLQTNKQTNKKKGLKIYIFLKILWLYMWPLCPAKLIYYCLLGLLILLIAQLITNGRELEFWWTTTMSAIVDFLEPDTPLGLWAGVCVSIWSKTKHPLKKLWIASP